MHAQVNVAQEKYMELWIHIIKQKISNQSRALSILGLDGAERIAEYVATGFHPTFGIHHDNQLNAFNLADDLIEPYRAIVDLVAHNIILDASTKDLKLPMILPIESMEEITE